MEQWEAIGQRRAAVTTISAMAQELNVEILRSVQHTHEFVFGADASVRST